MLAMDRGSTLRKLQAGILPKQHMIVHEIPTSYGFSRNHQPGSSRAFSSFNA